MSKIKTEETKSKKQLLNKMLEAYLTTDYAHCYKERAMAIALVKELKKVV